VPYARQMARSICTVLLSSLRGKMRRQKQRKDILVNATAIK
jgi:hypothetical protein